MNGRSKLMTWLTVLAFSLPAVGLTGCGYYFNGENVYGFLFFLLFGGSSMEHSGRDAAPVLDGTLAMPGLGKTLTMKVNVEKSGAMYQEADGATVIGFQDVTAGVLVEVAFPGQSTGEFQVTAGAESSELAPFFRVQTFTNDYSSLNGGTLRMVLDGDYPAVGESYTGRVEGTIASSKGELQQVSFAFSATRDL